MRKNNPMYGAGLYVAATTDEDRERICKAAKARVAAAHALEDKLKTIKVSDKVRFDSERRYFTVRARNKRYIICTRYYPERKTVLYTVIDTVEMVRGPDNMVFCFGYESDKNCQDRLRDLAAKRAEVSHRHRVDLGKIYVKRHNPKYRFNVDTVRKDGVVTRFNKTTYLAGVKVGRQVYTSHSTTFHGGRANDFPKKGDKVEVVFQGNRLVLVRKV